MTVEASSTRKAFSILVLDDSRAFLSGIRSILESAGHQVIIHQHSHDAWQALKTTKIDVLICDLEMPEISGFEFIKKVRGQFTHAALPILVLTGNANSKTMSDSIKYGADAFCLKENVQHTLIAQILGILRVKEAYEAAAQGKQLEAVQSLIGVYKHELGNNLTIFEGMLRRLRKRNPEFNEDPTMQTLLTCVEKFNITLGKLSNLRNYNEIQYSSGTKVLKVG